jgi:hypothetical protein
MLDGSTFEDQQDVNTEYQSASTKAFEAEVRAIVVRGRVPTSGRWGLRRLRRWWQQRPVSR